jgi:adenylate cyclase
MNKPHRWQSDPDPLSGQERASFAGVRRDLSKIPLIRLLFTILFVVLAIFLARFSWQLPFTGKDGQPVRIPIVIDAERALYDVRSLFAGLSHPVDQDQRILMVTYNQDTLAATGKRSPLDRAILARALTSLDAMGAKGIGIDILIDQAQPEDEQLIAALKGMKTPVWLGYATNTYSGTDVEVWQQEFMDRMTQRLAGSNVKKASIRLEADPDNVIRSWPSEPAALPPLLPLAMTGRGDLRAYTGSIAFRMPKDRERLVFLNLPIDLFANPQLAPVMAAQAKGRYILVGGDLADVDRFETPETRLADEKSEDTRNFRATTAGLEVHATMLAQVLDGHLPGRIGPVALWVLAILVVLSGAFTAMLDVRPWVLGLAVLGQLAFYGITPFWFENNGIDTQGLPAFGWLAGWMLAFATTGAAARAIGSDQRRFAQSALGKYLPRDVAAQILRDPDKLSLTGERRDIFCLFTDIEGFTKLSHVIPAEKTASILNAYLDGMSDIVLDQGGTIDKFVGDAVVAFWGAPIARPGDGDHAVEALMAMLAFTQGFGKGDADSEKLGRTRIGLHHGEAIVGNFGGEGRIQYTALGDAMNCAARLEGANKYLKSVALVSDAAKVHCTLDIFRPMGRIVLSGRATPIVVWEPAPEMPAPERHMLADLWGRFDGGESAVLHEIEAIAAKYDKDAALSAFACRLREAGPDGAFELGEK